MTGASAAARAIGASAIGAERALAAGAARSAARIARPQRRMRRAPWSPAPRDRPRDDGREIEPGWPSPSRGRACGALRPRACRVASNEAVGPIPTGRGRRRRRARAAPGPVLHAGRRPRAGARPAGARIWRVRSRSAVRAVTRLEFLLDAIGPGHRAARGARRRARSCGWWARSGIGFTSPPDGDASPLLVGGGIGIAPLVIWAEALRERGRAAAVAARLPDGAHAPAARLLAGDVADRDRRRLGRTITGSSRSCSSASCAAHGTSCTHAAPRRCWRRFARICVQRAVPAQLAMEAAMACGFGACFGCVVRTRSGYRRLCVDGPVVAAADLEERLGVTIAPHGSRTRLGVELAGLRLAHPVLNGSGHLRRDRGAAHVRRRAARALPVLRIRLQDDHARASRRQSAAPALGGARPA